MRLVCGKPPALTREQFAEVERRIALHLAHAPAAIARDMGVRTETLREYLNGFRPKHWRAR